MFCTRCGVQVAEGNRFCQACGQEIGATANPPAATAAATSPVPMAGTQTVSVPLPYAGFWVRFAASLIDGLILGIPFCLVVVVLVFMFGGFAMMLHRNPVDPAASAAMIGQIVMLLVLMVFALVILEWLYFAGMESSARQATFGKSAMSVRVTNYDGQRISFGHASGRFFSKFITGLIPLALGYIMAGFTEKKQALHDMIAGTLVLRK